MQTRGALLLVAVLVGGAVLLLAAVGDVARRDDRVAGMPVRVVAPVGQPAAGALVLAHGFAGSAAMIDPLASALARAGLVVVVPDLPGHGDNTQPLDPDALATAVGQAVSLAREQAGEVSVAGHSMGAGAVTSWAIQNRTTATVAVSLPSADGFPADAARPANLLLLWGDLEPARFGAAAQEALQRGQPGGQPGITYGQRAVGTARRAVPIPGAEHITVLYRAGTAREIAAWLQAPGEPRGDLRGLGAALLLLGGVLGARMILRPPPGEVLPTAVVPLAGEGPAAGDAGRAGWALRPVGLLAAAAAAGLGAALDRSAGGWLPVALAGYVAVWFGVGALVLGAVGRRLGAPVGTVRGALRGLAAGSLLAACLAAPARVTWAAFGLVGVRWLVLGVLLVVLLAWFWAEARLLVGAPRRGMLVVGSRVIVTLAMLAAVAWLSAPGFLVLLVPVMLPLLLVLAAAAGPATDPAAAATVQALPLALAVATTFPLLG